MEEKGVGSPSKTDNFKKQQNYQVFVLDGTSAYLDEAFRNECERHIPSTDNIEPYEAANAYLYIKAYFL